MLHSKFESENVDRPPTYLSLPVNWDAPIAMRGLGYLFLEKKLTVFCINLNFSSPNNTPKHSSSYIPSFVVLASIMAHRQWDVSGLQMKLLPFWRSWFKAPPP